MQKQRQIFSKHFDLFFIKFPIIFPIIYGSTLYLFPNYLMHSVNPFYGDGERRSISFNAIIDEKIYDIYSQ